MRTHPDTGRKALFVNRMFTSRLVQLEQHESDAVLKMLFRHIENREFRCRFRWEGLAATWSFGTLWGKLTTKMCVRCAMVFRAHLRRFQ